MAVRSWTIGRLVFLFALLLCTKSTRLLTQALLTGTTPSLLSHLRQRVISWSHIKLGGTRGDNIHNDNDSDPDLFDYFDPLLSPHAYPNGISPEHAPLSNEELEKKPQVSAASTNVFGFRLEQDTVMVDDHKMTDSLQSAGRVVEPKIAASPDVFDPLLSPHAYPNGTPEKILGEDEGTTTTKGRIGILIIDHGSRNDASNQRLHQLASIYQESYGSSRTVVRAAHMEIASPTIPEAIKALLDETSTTDSQSTLDEIICHPFFLSPLGRHSSEDIPRIVEEAKKDLSIDIPITITQPVGAETGILMQAVHSVIQESTKNKARLKAE